MTKCEHYNETLADMGGPSSPFSERFTPCEVDASAIANFVSTLNKLLETEPDAISAHLKALQSATGCHILMTNTVQRPRDVATLIKSTRSGNFKCAALPNLQTVK